MITRPSIIFPHFLHLLLLLLLLLESDLSHARRYRKDFNPNARHFRIVNNSMSVAQVYWMHLGTEERVLQMELIPGAKDALNSHVIHEFEVREKPNKEGFCKGKKGRCRKRYFQISAQEDQVFTITPDFSIEESNNLSRAKKKAKDALRDCLELKQELARNLQEGGPLSPLEQLDQLAHCAAENIQPTIYDAQQQVDFESNIRRQMGSKLQHFACQSPTFYETEPLDVQEWNPNSNPRLVMDNLPHTTRVLLQADTTMIATIENMVRPSDCYHVQRVATWNANLLAAEVPWEARRQPETIDFLSRIFAYVDTAVKLMDLYAGLPAKDQNLFQVYYDDDSTTSNNPQQQERVRRHHAPHTYDWPVSSDYFARLYLFCEVPQEGGAIHFPESATHYYPRLGEALLVTYTRVAARQGRLNEHISNDHIDCPVLAGNRTMIEHQFRLLPKT